MNDLRVANLPQSYKVLYKQGCMLQEKTTGQSFMIKHDENKDVYIAHGQDNFVIQQNDTRTISGKFDDEDNIVFGYHKDGTKTYMGHFENNRLTSGVVEDQEMKTKLYAGNIIYGNAVQNYNGNDDDMLPNGNCFIEHDTLGAIHFECSYGTIMAINNQDVSKHNYTYANLMKAIQDLAETQKQGEDRFIDLTTKDRTVRLCTMLAHPTPPKPVVAQAPEPKKEEQPPAEVVVVAPEPKKEEQPPAEVVVVAPAQAPAEPVVAPAEPEELGFWDFMPDWLKNMINAVKECCCNGEEVLENEAAIEAQYNPQARYNPQNMPIQDGDVFAPAPEANRDAQQVRGRGARDGDRGFN